MLVKTFPQKRLLWQYGLARMSSAASRETRWNSKESYEAFVKSQSALPKGFSAATTSIKFLPRELGSSNTKHMDMDLTLIKPDKPVERQNYAAVFTRSLFPGAPVVVGKQILASGKSIGGILVNSKVSNVRAENGVSIAEELCTEMHQLLQLPDSVAVLPSSTGVIGWRLPKDEMKAALPALRDSLDSESIFAASQAIMTTDNYPKARSAEIFHPKTGEKLGSITGIAKGAGMVEPNMATMLVYVVTDLAVGNLDTCLTTAVNTDASFNRISVDSDQSTSDTMVLLSSAQVEKPSDVSDTEWSTNFQSALNKVSKELAHDVVRNGEGVGHVIEVSVKGAPSIEVAHGTGKAVVNSPLVKTAIAGNDPNVGRIIMALGDYLGNHFGSEEWAQGIADRTSIVVGDITVYNRGQFTLDGEKEIALTSYLTDKSQELKGYPPHEETVKIEVDLGQANGFQTTVIGADLTGEYVTVNAGYRS